MLLYHSLVECHVIKLGKLYHANLLMVYMLNHVKCTQIIDIIDRHAYEIDGASMNVKYIQRKRAGVWVRRLTWAQAVRI